MSQAAAPARYEASALEVIEVKVPKGLGYGAPSDDDGW
jgi:hypothetical protein